MKKNDIIDYLSTRVDYEFLVKLVTYIPDDQVDAQSLQSACDAYISDHPGERYSAELNIKQALDELRRIGAFGNLQSGTDSNNASLSNKATRKAAARPKKKDGNTRSSERQKRVRTKERA